MAQPSITMRLTTLCFITILYVDLTAVSAYTPHFRPHHLRSQDMTGIWKLTHQSSLLPNVKSDDNTSEEEILLSLNEDGTFDRYETSSELQDQDLHMTLGRGGSWEYRDNKLFLAPQRPEDADPSKVHDTLLAGELNIKVSDSLVLEDKVELEEGNADGEVKKEDNNNAEIDVHLSIAQGNISVGKFMYPRKHKAFFDDPMLFKKSSVGSFSASQVLGNLNARLKSEREEKKPVAKYHKKDFHGRKFYLTANPHPVDPAYAEQDKRYDETKVLHHMQFHTIDFHKNNTFSVIGTEKILRGRFGLAGEKRDRLWFQVSLFGTGRSAPGSVYSEGRLLTHEDRRGYVGKVEEFQKNNSTRYFITEGLYYYGTDLQRALRPDSGGVFSLQEIDDEAKEEEEDYGETDSEDCADENAWDEEDAFQ
ncbi:unnamed protein product [Cylindrotheca closterium]|uniref:Uncharacterized protein n=1 Tax=Cylindrotheca closterium TaxID=2856 RepID=A0AAD2CS14_9STRA|nr:unnamed protein product [Cylindrotheca closterium]